MQYATRAESVRMNAWQAQLTLLWQLSSKYVRQTNSAALIELPITKVKSVRCRAAKIMMKFNTANY